MKSITFSNVLPQVFAGQNNLVSDIWLQNVTFEKDKCYLIKADSGKGKSTFCSYIVGYRHDYTGQVCFDNIPTAGYTIGQWVHARQQHVSHLFQELRLFPELTALENIQIKNEITLFKSHKEISDWFEELGIADKMHQKIGRMSFGQQQRVALIRSLVQPFDFILADEPISHLDDHNAEIMGKILMQEAKAQGAGVIITSIGKHINLDYDKIYML